MKIIRFLDYPDLVGGIIVGLIFFGTLWWWPESRRPFIEFIGMAMIGVLFGTIGLLLDGFFRKRSKGEGIKKDKHRRLVRAALMLFVTLGFLTNYVPVFVKYWTYSFLIGFMGTLIITLFLHERKARKRFEWKDL